MSEENRRRTCELLAAGCRDRDCPGCGRHREETRPFSGRGCPPHNRCPDVTPDMWYNYIEKKLRENPEWLG